MISRCRLPPKPISTVYPMVYNLQEIEGFVAGGASLPVSGSVDFLSEDHLRPVIPSNVLKNREDRRFPIFRYLKVDILSDRLMAFRIIQGAIGRTLESERDIISSRAVREDVRKVLTALGCRGRIEPIIRVVGYLHREGKIYASFIWRPERCFLFTDFLDREKLYFGKAYLPSTANSHTGEDNDTDKTD